MTFVLEWRSFWFGLLTATALASITAITERVIKRLLPRPHNFDRRRRHIDGRDALSELIVSCEGCTALIAGPFVHHTAQGRCPRPPLGRIVRIALLFVFSFIVTMFFETITILASGSQTKVLYVPDIMPFSFLQRHLIVDGAKLQSIQNATLNKQRCVENGLAEFNDTIYFSYWQGACFRTKIRRDDVLLSNWTLFTEENQVDAFKLFLGRVLPVNDSAIATKKWEKITYAQIALFIQRRITHNEATEKRVLDADSARVVSKAVHDSLPRSRCSFIEWQDKVLDRDQLHGRPAMLGNFTCNPPLSVREAVNAMERGAIASIGLYYYDAKPQPKFVNPADSVIIRKEQEFRAGMSVTESYEDQWFIALFAITAFGVLCFGLDRLYSQNTYPNVALLAIMNDISRRDAENSFLPGSAPPRSSTAALIAHASAISSETMTPGQDSTPTIRHGFVQRGDAESIALQQLPQVAQENRGIKFT